MGLDGISINQLRVTPEFNSAELNNNSLSVIDDTKPIDGLSEGQKVNSDEENRKEGYNGAFSSGEEEENEDAVEEEVTKYDLSDSTKYSLKLDEKLNKIIIIEKSSGNVIQLIDAEELSRFVAFAPNPCGSIVNRKF